MGNGRSPVHASVQFAPGVRSDLLSRVEIRSGVGIHEIAILDFRRRAGDIAPPDGCRVRVRWGGNTRWAKTFYGYVNHTERVDSASDLDANSYRVFCVGTSKPLNEVHPRHWTQVTGSFIARAMAERYSLRAVLSKGTSLINWVQPTNESDFASMNRLAKQSGMLFWVSGSTLNFVDPAVRLLTASSGSVQTFTRSFPVRKNPEDTLREMLLVKGPDAPGSGSQVTSAYGIDPNTGGLLKATGNRAYSDAGLAVPTSAGIYSGVIHSGSEGAAITSSGLFAGTWATMMADVWVKDIPVYVGDIVNIAGSGVGNAEKGLWFVSETLEVMKYRNDSFGYDYSANLTMTRNQSDTHVMQSTKNLTGVNPVVPAVWVGEKWQSQSLESVYV